MTPLSRKLINLLTTYKRLVSRHLTPQVRAEKIKALGLARCTLREDDEIVLYRKAQQVVQEIKDYLKEHTDGHLDYCGLEVFCSHIESVLNECTVTDSNQLVSRQREAVRAMCTLVQLLSLPQVRFTLEVTNRIERAIQRVAYYGSSDQHRMLKRALQEYYPKHPALFNALMAGFQRHKNMSRPF